MKMDTLTFGFNTKGEFEQKGKLLFRENFILWYNKKRMAKNLENPDV